MPDAACRRRGNLLPKKEVVSTAEAVFFTAEAVFFTAEAMYFIA